MQRDSEWFRERIGRFTGSEIHKLMGVRGLGQTGETYAFEKAIEMAFGRNEDERFESFDMQRGIELEPIAFDKFSELQSADFIEVQKTGFWAYGENAGASPDGIIGDYGVLEIKCPRPEKFFNLVAKGVEAINNEYIYQMQMEMMCTNSKMAAFFNYVIYNGQPMWHTIVVNRDEVVIDLIKKRIDEAAIIRDNYVNLLLEKQQFPPTKQK